MQNLGLVRVYDSVESTIVTATGGASVPFTNVDESFYTIITNDNTTSGDDLLTQVNDSDVSTSPYITIKPGETLRLNEMQIKSIFLTNNSGNTISYRIILIGKP